MPWTLYRYILHDLVKVLTLSTVVLVLVISVAAAIKPLSDGVLDAVSMAKFVFYTTPTMVQFVLPVAGAFASTLVYSRMTANNEIFACSVSGLSYRAIALPVVVLGLGLTLAAYFSSNFVVPTFYRTTKQIVQHDLTELLVNCVQQGRPLILDDQGLILYADEATQIEPTAEMIRQLQSDMPPTQLVMLSGLAVAELDAQGRVGSDNTAEKAVALLFEVDGQTWVTLRLENVARFLPMKGEWGFSDGVDHPQFAIESPFRDHPRFLTWTELRRLSREPDRYDKVREAKQQLVAAIAAERLLQQIRRTLKGGIILSGPGDQTYELISPTVERAGQNLNLASRDQIMVRLEKFTSDRPAVQFLAPVGRLWIEVDGPVLEPRVSIELSDVRVLDRRLSDRGTEKSVETVKRVRWPEPLLDSIDQEHSVLELLDSSSEFGHVPAVREAHATLRYQLKRLVRRIIGQVSERMATSISCVLVLLLGALLSMHMRSSLPLVIYLYSFLLTVVAVIITRSGGNLIINLDYSATVGLLVIWSGDLVLVAAIGLTYWKLARN